MTTASTNGKHGLNGTPHSAACGIDRAMTCERCRTVPVDAASRIGHRDEPAVEPELPPADKLNGHDIILARFREDYRPLFRRGAVVYSDNLAREIKLSEAAAAPDITLIQQLAEASDAPCNKDGSIKTHALPSFFKTWCAVSWGTLLRSLPEETASDEVSASAEEEFRLRMSEALHSQVTIGESCYEQGKQITTTQRRSLIDWCLRFSKSGPWKSIRSYALWCRTVATPANAVQLEIALRKELFTQINYRPLADLTQNKLARLCQLYSVGIAERAQAQRVVVLDHGFVDSLYSGPATVARQDETAPEREPGEEG